MGEQGKDSLKMRPDFDEAQPPRPNQRVLVQLEIERIIKDFMQRRGNNRGNRLSEEVILGLP